MSRTSKKVAIAVVTVGIVATTAFANLNAENIYDDSNIGISSALDRYVESVQNDGELLNKSADYTKKATEKTEATDNNVAGDDSSDEAVTDTEKTEITNNTSDDAEEAADDVTEEASEETTEETTEEETSTCKYPQFQDRCLTTVETEVNIRAEADEDSELVGTLASCGIALVKEKGDQWTKIASGTCEGYIRNDFLVFGDDAGEYAETHCNKLATITTETLNVRAEADESSDCITMVPGGESYVIMDEADGWLKIEIDDGTSGYISADYADITFSVVRAISVEEAEAAQKAAEEAAAAELKRQQEEAELQKQAEETQQSSYDSSSSDDSSSNYDSSSSDDSSSDNDSSSSDDSSSNYDSSSSDDSSSNNDSSSSDETVVETPKAASSGSTGTELANYALQFVGNPYVYGGTSLTNGADCSGFTLSVYANYGISLPHSASAQANYGTEVSLSDLEAGDLLFYADPDGSIGHVAIYTGDGNVVHASTEATGIKTSVYNYRTIVKAVRLLGQ